MYVYHSDIQCCMPACVMPYHYFDECNNQIQPIILPVEFKEKTASYELRCDEKARYRTFIELASQSELTSHNWEMVWCFKTYGDCKIGRSQIAEQIAKGGYTPFCNVDGMAYYRPFGENPHEMIATFRAFCRLVLNAAEMNDIDLSYTAMIAIPIQPDRGL